MPQIQILDPLTIDKIAAGEVIERPASVIKELVENAIDAGASSIAVEIEEGGISLIRVVDNGEGIPREQIPRAFLRHSTSKIRCVEDLARISSLGFRAEALSSIAAVTKVELITKSREETYGSRYRIEGGKELSLEDTGAPDGTTFVARQLFYNVPARRKFLKTAVTEAGHVQDLLLRMALSHPEVAVLFRNNGQEKLRTFGSGRQKDVIYQVYGRNVSADLLELDFEKNGIHITGYIGTPGITRGNRNFEHFFVNGRYVKSPMISRALEDAYKGFLMQHKFPFAVLAFDLAGEQVDVNVHPTKMELRFQRQQEVYDAVFEGIHQRLLEPELISQVTIPEPAKPSTGPQETNVQVPPATEKTAESPFRLRPQKPSEKPEAADTEPRDEAYFIRKMRERVQAYHQRTSSAEVPDRQGIFQGEEARQKERIQKAVHIRETTSYGAAKNKDLFSKEADAGRQMDLFEEKLLKRNVRAEYRLIGQVFDTYWLIQFQEQLYIIDQHAAHERVLYERTLKGMQNREYTSQYITPPLILTLSMQEEETLQKHMDRFSRIGFEIEPFGGDAYALRAVPDNLFGLARKDLFLEMLDALTDGIRTSMTPDLLDEKIASLSCKAAVKGNNRLSPKEVDELIGELLLLDNPYHCPHGRPTIIAISKRELEKKFKRIV